MPLPYFFPRRKSSPTTAVLCYQQRGHRPVRVRGNEFPVGAGALKGYSAEKRVPHGISRQSAVIRTAEAFCRFAVRQVTPAVSPRASLQRGEAARWRCVVAGYKRSALQAYRLHRSALLSNAASNAGSVLPLLARSTRRNLLQMLFNKY